MAAFLATELPLAPGTSPFRVKGSVYRRVLERLDHDVPGGAAATIELVPGTDEVRAFFRQHFLIGGWYDYLPLVLLAHADIAVNAPLMKPGLSEEAILGELARRHAEMDLKGIYKVLLRVTAPRTAIARMAYVHRQYFSFGSLDIQISRGRADTEVGGWPAVAAPLFRIYNSAFAQRLLNLSGARRVIGEWQPPKPDGERSGVPLVRIRGSITWSE
jgi:hypothetical protein